MRRLFLTLMLVLVPVAVRADSSTSASDLSDSASALQNTGQAASSSQTSSILQPAGSSGTSLQAAGVSGTGAAQSAVENLQQSGDSDQAKLMIEAEGDVPQVLSSNSPDLDWLLYVLLVLVVASIGTGAALEWQRRTI